MKKFAIQDKAGSYLVNAHIFVANIEDAVVYEVADVDLEQFYKDCAKLNYIPVEVK